MRLDVSVVSDDSHWYMSRLESATVEFRGSVAIAAYDCL